MAKSCTVLSPGKCKRCRSPCPKDKFESTACGGAMDRECTDISKLPPVSVSEMIVTENRKKVKLAYKRLHPKKGEKLVAVLDRGTGIKVVVNVLEASFDVKVEEATSQNYAVNPPEKPLYELCRHQMPVYYVARHHVLQDKFYYGQRKNTHCNKKIPEFKNDGVYCINSDHDLIRLFTKGKSEKETFVHSEGSKLCEKLLRDCFNCADNCGKASLASSCINGKVSCYDSCRKAKCDCSREECFCQKYIENCAGKASDCVGTSVSKITLEPIFSQQYLYCYVKILRLATYSIKTDILVNGSLVVSRYREVATKVKNQGHSMAEDDLGYMFVKVSDSLNLNGKNLLLRREKDTKSLEVGHFKMADDIYGGPATDNLALWPRAPYSLSKKQWSNMTCKRAQVDAFRVFDKYPISTEEPNIFEKLYGLSLKEEARTIEGNRVFSISKRNENRFIDVTMPAHKSLLRNIFPASDIIQSELHGSLLNKSSHWSVSVGGSLKSCPGSFTAKLFDQARSDSLLFHTDIAVTRGDNCFFKFEFNMPFKNTEEENERVFVVHLITRKQTIKLVLLKEKKIKRILQMIHIPPVDKGRLLNAILPISVIAGGFVFLLVVLLAFGVLTKPTDQLYQVDVDNEFHFRHALVIVWFVCARLAKSILLTITFLSYIFVVIHSKNYHTLKSFNEFQLREKTVIKSIYEDMERHRVAEINRQEKRFTEEKNICEINMQKLDAYLAERKRDSSWEQQINKRAKSIKRAAIQKFEVRYAKIVRTYYETKNMVKTSTENHFRTIERFVRGVKGKVLGHPYLKPAKVPFGLYRFFKGSKNWAQYIGLDVNLNNLNYYNRWESASSEISHVSNALRRTKNKQEKSENMNYRAWMEQSKSRIYEKPPMVYKIRYPKVNHGLGFDKGLVKKVFGVTWVTELTKKKIFSYIGMVMMIALDALFFVYRHTRTYAMAASMVYGFKKICNLDKMQEDWQKDAEKNEILKQGFRFRRKVSQDHTTTTTNEEYTSDERGIVGEGLSTSTDEYEAKKKMGSRIFEKTYGSSQNTSSCSVVTGISNCSARGSLESNDTSQNYTEKSDNVQHQSLSARERDQIDDKDDSVEEAEDKDDMMPSGSREVTSDESDGSSESMDETSRFIAMVIRCRLIDVIYTHKSITTISNG
ncbi:uncharacterized protein LOC135691395 isoform X2 [Rhopilema esculentum]|uniref:uncharacterized protein LOC135691395 isoform X2 n=1 Tax=Rhopilema esculentum TaxID=499914 RepID=UPI0031D879B7